MHIHWVEVSFLDGLKFLNYEEPKFFKDIEGDKVVLIRVVRKGKGWYPSRRGITILQQRQNVLDIR